MKLTQMCFDQITVDGRQWAVVISCDGGVPKVRSLHGGQAVPRTKPLERTAANPPALRIARDLNSSDGLPLLASCPGVMCAKDTH